MQHFCIKQAVYAILMQETIDLSQTNYGSNANNLWMERIWSIDEEQTIHGSNINGPWMWNKPCIFSGQTICFSFFRVVRISVFHFQSAICWFPFVSFHSPPPSDGNIAFSLCIKSKVSKRSVLANKREHE